MKQACILLILCTGISCSLHQVRKNRTPGVFYPELDLISLHYDHAPDKDDGQSAAADRTMRQVIYSAKWIKEHVIPVSGAYGKNADTFNPDSDSVMDATWNDCGGWLAAHDNREEVLTKLTKRWTRTIEAGGDIWVKEGGQSDITAAVVKMIIAQSPEIDTKARIHIVQHSKWNEDQATDEALDYVKQHTNYIKIKDANSYLNIEGGDETFEQAAKNSQFGAIWEAAFVYYNPRHRLDFSDTGELMHILGVGELGFDEFREYFLN